MTPSQFDELRRGQWLTRCMVAMVLSDVQDQWLLKGACLLLAAVALWMSWKLRA